ncbi:MAG TPA: MerC domain-containing protein, partial [Sphingobacteriaceae bacterium]
MAKPTPATTGAETDNKEKKINLISNLSNEDRYAYDTIKLREIKGHEWWLITLLILMFLSPFIAIWISTVNHFERPRLLYLLVSGILIVIWFFCHFIYYLNRVQEYETSSKEGKVYRIGNNSIVDDRWKKIWGIYNKNYPKRVRKYIIGLLRLELFGWITWTTAVVVAISEQLALTLNLNSANSFKIAEAISNQISSNGGAIPTVASINEIIMQQLKLTPQNLWEHYSIVMENASYGLARATVLGIITLFFTQMLKFYQANITLNYDAAESAKKAATDSNKAIGEIKEFRKALHSELENHKDIIKGSYGIVDGEWLFLNLIKLVSNIQDQVKNIKFAKLIEPLKTQIQKITIELAKSNEDNDKTEFNALTVLQSTYFETEALNFEEPVGVDSYKEEENKPDTLRKGVRLSTNYTHYAKAVQSLVDTFESEPSHAYEYYTILNEKQDGFFNIENDKVNLRWQV